MHSVHLRGIHVPKGPNLWLSSVVAVLIFSFSLALFLIFSFVGGDGFRESMGGDVGLSFLIGGLLVSAVFAVIEKQER